MSHGPPLFHAEQGHTPKRVTSFIILLCAAKIREVIVKVCTMKFSLEVISILRNSIRMNVGSSSIALDDVQRTMNINLNNLHHHSGRDVQFVLAHAGLFLHTLRPLEEGFIQQDRDGHLRLG